MWNYVLLENKCRPLVPKILNYLRELYVNIISSINTLSIFYQISLDKFQNLFNQNWVIEKEVMRCAPVFTVCGRSAGCVNSEHTCWSYGGVWGVLGIFGAGMSCNCRDRFCPTQQPPPTLVASLHTLLSFLRTSSGATEPDNTRSRPLAPIISERFFQKRVRDFLKNKWKILWNWCEKWFFFNINSLKVRGFFKVLFSLFEQIHC